MSFLTSVLLFRPKEIVTRCYNKIVATDNGNTIVALHRDRDKRFPYEYSKPLPEEQKDNSVLRMTDYEEVMRVFKDISPEMARKQLSTLTLTTPHRWFPRARDKRAKKTEMNRPYL